MVKSSGMRGEGIGPAVVGFTREVMPRMAVLGQAPLASPAKVRSNWLAAH